MDTPPGQPERRNWGILLRHFWGRVALTGDAQGIAQIVRTRWFKAVHLKSATGQRPRTLTAARKTVRAVTANEQVIRRMLRSRGLSNPISLLEGALGFLEVRCVKTRYEQRMIARQCGEASG